MKPKASSSFVAPTPFGTLVISTENDKIINIEFSQDKTTPASSKDSFAQQIIAELNSYFKNPQHKINLAIELTGTPFQQKVWIALQQIPVGSVLTYGALAKKLKTSARAIGQACRTNPLPIIVPCHRIVSATDLGGFAGKAALLPIKKWLLNHEGVNP